MEEISSREFRRRMREVFDGTLEGKEYVIMNKGNRYKISLFGAEVKESIDKKESYIRKDVMTYGCGCPKTDGYLCKKHGRS